MARKQRRRCEEMLRRDVKVLANEPIEQILEFDGVPLCGD
jgi:hypothetical protein